VLHRFTRNLDCAGTVGELTEQTAGVAHEMIGARSDTVCFAEETRLPENVLSLLMRNGKALLALSRDPQSAISSVQGYDVALHYGGEPVLYPDVEKVIGVSVRKDDVPLAAEVELRVPEGWDVEPAGEMPGQYLFRIRAKEVPDRNAIGVAAKVDGRTLEAEYVMLGPGEAKGYPCGDNVPTCPRCHARIEACICDPQSETTSDRVK